jgi:chemotaxis-related protein WspD
MFDALSINDCWNTIGIWGNAECPELKKHIHCRNCPVYSAGAREMLNVELPLHYLDEWTNFVAREKEIKEPDIHSTVIFCIGSEWFALSTRVFKEVAELKTIHSLPHHRQGLILGIVNVRGELLVCVSLAHALGLEKKPENASQEKKRMAQHRLLVISDEGRRLVFPVDEVGGIHHFSPKEVRQIPATLAGVAAVHTTGVLSWRNKSVGCLDEQLLFYTLNKGLS